MSSDSLVEMMEKYHKEYYQSQGKNMFFKKGQKLDCAKEMSKVFQLEEMIQQTTYIIPETNKIVFNYTIFKLYANDDNYQTIIQKVITLYDEILVNHAKFEAHVILDTFTISAAERYKNAIKMFCEMCMNSNTKYTEFMEKMYIYYTPSMIESIATILRPFIDTSIQSRIVYYSKVESKELLEKLFVSIA
jgi:hypothetical protein